MLHFWRRLAIFVGLALGAALGPSVVSAQTLICDNTGNASFLDRNMEREPISLGTCGGEPSSIPLSQFETAEGTVLLPNLMNGAPPPPPCAGARMCWGGTPDNFALPVENATTSQALASVLSACPSGAHTQFDSNPTDGACFGHSFLSCWPSGCILTFAKLQIRMRAIRHEGSNDFIHVLSGGQSLWSSRISSLPEANGRWTTGSPDRVFLIDLNALPGGGGSILNQLTNGVDVRVQDDTAVDFARLIVRFDCCGKICGTKFLDGNCDGIQDAEDGPLAGWQITLSDAGGKGRVVNTAADGSYCFDHVRPGTYTIGELSQTGWTQTAPPSPGRHTVEITSGQTVDHLDFGNQLCAECGGEAEPEGACCTRSGCVRTSFAKCSAEGGLWAGQTCSTGICSQRGGACCTQQGCIHTLATGCMDLGGVWRGDRSSCKKRSCP